jgi:hypothetical protein
MASTLTPFVLGCAWGGYLFDHQTRTTPPPAAGGCPATHATGEGTGP